MPIEGVVIPLTGAGDATAEVAVDLTPDGVAQLFKLAYSADGSAVLVPADAEGLLTAERLEDPQDELLVATALAAGGTANLDATNITAGKTGRLLGADIGSSVPARCDIQVVSGPRTTRTTVYVNPGESVPWRPPRIRFIELAGGGTNHFGASVVNLSPHLTADVRVTLYWDEVS